MGFIYLSPHLDDVAFSCGGLIWEQARAGEDVQIWTICAGHPPDGPLSAFAQSLHERWGTSDNTVELRRAEDKRAAKILGASTHWFEFADCIYRIHPQNGHHLYATSATIFGAVLPVEQDLLESISRKLRQELAEDDKLVVPLGIGNHVDHQLVRSAANKLKRTLYYYADFPYVVSNENLIGYQLPAGSSGDFHPISKRGLGKWQKAVLSYASQVRNYWPDDEKMKAALEAYWGMPRGLQIWQAPSASV